MSTSLSMGVGKRGNGNRQVSASDVQRADLDLVSRVFHTGSHCKYHFQIEPHTGIVWLVPHDPMGQQRIAGRVKTRNCVNLSRPVRVGRIRDLVWEPYPDAPITAGQLKNAVKFVLSDRIVARTAQSYQPLSEDAERFPKKPVRKIKFATR